ncbi:MAG: hypothetical protein ACP5KN_10605 [Armatimonadota bacterium]
MASATVAGSTIVIETDLLSAEVHTEGYVSGVAGGTLLDKTTGARDLSFGLDIADFLLEPQWDDPDADIEHPYHGRDMVHGHLPHRYVEGPQICTKAGALEHEVIEGDDFVAVRQWYRWRWATYGRTPGSRWEQCLVFRDGWRHFLAHDRITSANDVDALIFRLDMPGHLKHDRGEGFEQVYLSYHGLIPAEEFMDDFPPDERFLYQRDDSHLPDTMIRAYQVTMPDCSAGPWLAGITLDPAVVYQAWCHQRGYVCYIEEIGGRAVKAGESFGAAYAVGWFDDLGDADEIARAWRGCRELDVRASGRDSGPASAPMRG